MHTPEGRARGHHRRPRKLNQLLARITKKVNDSCRETYGVDFFGRWPR